MRGVKIEVFKALSKFAEHSSETRDAEMSDHYYINNYYFSCYCYYYYTYCYTCYYNIELLLLLLLQ